MNIKCQCKESDKHGETSVMCCNHCGLPTEEFWTNGEQSPQLKDIVQEMEKEVGYIKSDNDYNEGYVDAVNKYLPKLKQIGEGSEAGMDIDSLSELAGILGMCLGLNAKVFKDDYNKEFLMDVTQEIIDALNKFITENKNKNEQGCPEFPHFGASYPDARCIDGYLWDLDSCENIGGETYLTFGGDDPCPFCNPDAYVEFALDEENGVTKEKILKYIERLRLRYGKQ